MNFFEIENLEGWFPLFRNEVFVRVKQDLADRPSKFRLLKIKKNESIIGEFSHGPLEDEEDFRTKVFHLNEL